MTRTLVWPGVVRHVFWLIIIAGIALPLTTLHGAPVIVKDGDTAQLEGTITFLDGLDTDERPIVYAGLRLASPVTFTDLGEKSDTDVVRLLPRERHLGALRKYVGMRVQVKGKALYRWYGPSAAPVSTMLIVEEIRCAGERVIPYEPTAVTLYGRVSVARSTHPNGMPMVYAILTLPATVTVEGEAGPPNPINVREPCVHEIQLSSSKLHAKLLAADAQQVAVTGTLFHGHTAWHMRDVVMAVTTVTVGP